MSGVIWRRRVISLNPVELFREPTWHANTRHLNSALEKDNSLYIADLECTHPYVTCWATQLDDMFELKDLLNDMIAKVCLCTQSTCYPLTTQERAPFYQHYLING